MRLPDDLFSPIRLALVILLLGMAAVGCSSTVDVEAHAPGMKVKAKYRHGGPSDTEQLPPGFTPVKSTTVRVKQGGFWFDVTLCVADDNVPGGCIWVKVGGCEKEAEWVNVCPIGDAAEQRPRSSAPIADGGDEVVAGSQMMSGPTHFSEGVDVSASKMCKEVGSIDFDFSRETAVFTFVVGCRNEILPSELIGEIWLTLPSGQVMGIDDFRSAYGERIPKGTMVQLSGPARDVAWNAYMFGRTALSFPYGNSQVDVFMIAVAPDQPPVLTVAVDGVVMRQQLVLKP